MAENPHNIIRLELPKTAEDTDEAYGKARAYLNEWLDEEILKCDEKPSIYIYEMVFDALGSSYSVKGYVSLVKLEEFKGNNSSPRGNALKSQRGQVQPYVCYRM